MIAQFLFLILLVIGIVFFVKSVKRLKNNIMIGKDFSPIGSKKDRLWQMVLIALGQKKMFKRPIPAFLHLIIYVGFLFINIELLEIIIDGLFGTHRVFLPVLGIPFYTFLINFFEFFAVGVIVVCIVFLIRRNVIGIKRFSGEEMSKWPKLDANLILVFEILLMLFLLNMNATDTAIQIKEQASSPLSFWASKWFVPLYENASLNSIHLAERFYWWAHFCGILCFANYVLYSKHLHIFLAFPNTYFTNIEPKGQMANMPAITQEVQLMMNPSAAATNPPEEIARFGAKDVQDLSWKNLLEAYSCTECGRCTSNCPANLTGKKLSPRKIMMDTRDRAEEVGLNRKKHGEAHDDGKSLIDDYITEEELLACTTCNACVEACPVNINPLNIILELRRYKTMEESKVPNEWTGMYQNVETSFNPWKFPPSDRFNWANELKKDE
ncbi:MAG: 4Fe-4S dicluster domain-containing protein [Cyclobacteriaceae bacterium]